MSTHEKILVLVLALALCSGSIAMAEKVGVSMPTQDLQRWVQDRNEAAASFLGRLIDAMEQAAAKKPDLSDDSALDEAGEDVYNRLIENPEWDRYEQSILRRLADSIKVFIRGELVHITVIKQFDE